MSERLLLFDIDGTILLSGGAGFRAMARAAEQLYEEPIRWDGIDPGGSLDPLIFRAALEQSGAGPPSAREHRRFREVYVEHLQEELARFPERMTVMPGVKRLLTELAARDGVVLGLLTGNYEDAARMKLSVAGFDWNLFHVGAFGDEAATRRELVPLAWQRYSTRFDAQVTAEATLIIGDTPRDVDCALASGCRVLGVGTGRHSAEALLAAGAHGAVDDLTSVDADALIKLTASSNAHDDEPGQQ